MKSALIKINIFQMQVKKEPETEPLVDDVKPMDEADSAMMPGEDKLATAVPEDVSLNTPVSNPEEIAAEAAEAAEPTETSTTTETSNGTAEPSTAHQHEKPSEESKTEGVTEDSVSNSLAAKEAEGGDLEGSVTAEDPPNPFDSDNDVVDDEVVDEPVADEPDDLMSQVPPPQPPEASSSQASMEAAGEVPVDKSPSPGAIDSTVEGDQGESMEPHTATEATTEEEAASSMEPMDTSVSNSDDKSEQDSRTEIVNGQNMDSRSAEEDLLTSTTNMEEGDEQYKNIIAESQMDNIFN